ncbi:MAG TPA: hypothetical protein VIV60_09505, partial [Polyangiaceae bacterium]
MPLLVTLLVFGCGHRGHGNEGATHKDHEAAIDIHAARAAGASAATSSSRVAPWLENAWDPKTGRGVVTHHQPGLGTMRTSFHVGYPGYTGGLVVGAYSSSGLAWEPERAIPEFPRINVFCAQDESIWDRDEHRE